MRGQVSTRRVGRAAAKPLLEAFRARRQKLHAGAKGCRPRRMEEKSLHHLVLGDRRNAGAIGKSSKGDIGRERREPYLVDQLPLAAVSHRPPKAHGLVAVVIDLEAGVGLTLILG